MKLKDLIKSKAMIELKLYLTSHPDKSGIAIDTFTTIEIATLAFTSHAQALAFAIKMNNYGALASEFSYVDPKDINPSMRLFCEYKDSGEIINKGKHHSVKVDVDKIPHDDSNQKSDLRTLVDEVALNYNEMPIIDSPPKAEVAEAADIQSSTEVLSQLKMSESGLYKTLAELPALISSGSVDSKFVADLGKLTFKSTTLPSDSAAAAVCGTKLSEKKDIAKTSAASVAAPSALDSYLAAMVSPSDVSVNAPLPDSLSLYMEYGGAAASSSSASAGTHGAPMGDSSSVDLYVQYGHTPGS